MLNEKLLKDRAGNFTASENHRLMAGWDKPPAPKIEEMPDLQGLYDVILPRYEAGERKFPVTPIKQIHPELEPNQKKIEAVIAAIKGDEPPAGLVTYAEEKALEELFDNDPSLNFETAHTRNGNEREVPCVELLSDERNLLFVKTGEDQQHIQVDGVGATPDGIVLDDSGLIETGCEVKCKSSISHARLFLLNNAKDLKEHAFEHFVQVQTQMLVTGADVWYFAIYNPFAKHSWLQFKSIKIHRDDSFLAVLHKRLEMAKEIKNRFLGEILSNAPQTEKIESEPSGEASLDLEV